MAEEGAATGAVAEKVIHTYPLIRGIPSQFGVTVDPRCNHDDSGITVDPQRNHNENTMAPLWFQCGSTDHTDMSEEMRTEAVELSVTACEKFSQNNELAARMVKESMDKKFGPAFHVVVGESYGFEITYECTTICYMYFGGNQAICIWKCS